MIFLSNFYLIATIITHGLKVFSFFIDLYPKPYFMCISKDYVPTMIFWMHQKNLCFTRTFISNFIWCAHLKAINVTSMMHPMYWTTTYVPTKIYPMYQKYYSKPFLIYTSNDYGPSRVFSFFTDLYSKP